MHSHTTHIYRFENGKRIFSCVFLKKYIISKTGHLLREIVVLLNIYTWTWTIRVSHGKSVKVIISKSQENSQSRIFIKKAALDSHLTSCASKINKLKKKSGKVYVMNHSEYRENKRTGENMSDSPASSIKIFA